MKKTKFRKFISILLTVVMVLSVSPVGELAGIDLANLFSVGAAAVESGTWSNGDLGSGTWNYYSETGTLEILGTGEMCDYDDPEDGDFVHHMPQWEAYLNGRLTLKIGEGITKIGEFAFLYSKFNSIYIPHSVTEIAFGAFVDCVCGDVYYNGTPFEWDRVAIEYYNWLFDDVPMHYLGTGGEEPVPTDSGTWSNGSLGSGTWSLDENGKLTVSGTGVLPNYSSSVRAPWNSYNIYTPTEIT